MSTTVDERVVEMRFDNKQFEQNLQTSLSSIDNQFCTCCWKKSGLCFYNRSD